MTSSSFMSALASLPLGRKLISKWGHRARRDGRWSEAASLYEAAISRQPGNYDLTMLAAHMHKEAGHLGDAERLYRHAEALRPHDPDLHLQLGHFFAQADRPIEAYSAYQRAARLDPNCEPARAGSIATGAAIFQDPAPNLYGRKWVVTPTLDDQILMWVNLADRYVSRACIEGQFELAETAFVRRHLKAGDVFLDIGANIGWFSALACTIVGPEGRVHAFEPHPETGAYLRKTLALNGFEERSFVHGVGLWSKAGELPLIWHPDNINPGGAHLSTRTLDAGGGGSSVPLQTLDHFKITRCDLMKIDIEGAEPHAIRGARNLIVRTKPIIISEMHPQQLRIVSDASVEEYLSLLSGMGYGARILKGDGSTVIENFADICRREEMFTAVFLPSV